jgi:pre-mRNA-splicing helicase BRR2
MSLEIREKNLQTYNAQDEDDNIEGDGDMTGEAAAELYERRGVAVVFDESDGVEDGVQLAYEVRDEDETSDEEPEGAEDHLGTEELAVAASVVEDEDR